MGLTEICYTRKKQKKETGIKSGKRLRVDTMVHKGKVRYRRMDVGRKGHHYLQIAYRGNKLIEAKLKPYNAYKKKDKEIQIYPRKRR